MIRSSVPASVTVRRAVVLAFVVAASSFIESFLLSVTTVLPRVCGVVLVARTVPNWSVTRAVLAVLAVLNVACHSRVYWPDSGTTISSPVALVVAL